MIKIICLGKIKENYLKDLINDYEKRIQKYHQLKIIELKDDNSLEKERDKILPYLNSKDFIITLEINGQSLTSEQFSELLNEKFIHYPCLTFVIGSSLGLHDDIKKKSNLALSFSSLTFPHGLFRGILLEQIYRAFKIINNETYHK